MIGQRRKPTPASRHYQIAKEAADHEADALRPIGLDVDDEAYEQLLRMLFDPEDDEPDDAT
jgi:hypothetical protein